MKIQQDKITPSKINRKKMMPKCFTINYKKIIKNLIIKNYKKFFKIASDKRYIINE